MRDSFSPNSWARFTSARYLLRAPCHSPELAIVTSATLECKLKCNLFRSPSSAFARLQRAEARLPRQLQPAKAGGEYRARTGDLLVANQALSQLS